jgi:hypothetical protein
LVKATITGHTNTVFAGNSFVKRLLVSCVFVNPMKPEERVRKDSLRVGA